MVIIRSLPVNGKYISLHVSVQSQLLPKQCNFKNVPFRHVGYAHEDDLPLNRGFDEGLYSHQGLQYYTRTFQRTFSRLDDVWGEPTNPIKARRSQLFQPNPNQYKLKIHDTYSIGQNESGHKVEVPECVWGEHVDSYSEDLYTEAVKEHIDEQDGDNPFFVYYSQWTPHANLVQPPNIRPDGSTMNYSVCYDAFPDRVEENCSLANDTRCVFCKQGRLKYILSELCEIY